MIRSPMFSSLGQRNVFPVIAQHVQNLHRIWGNPHNFVAPVHDVAFAGNEDIFILIQKNSLRTVGPARREPIKLEVARRQRWWWLRGITRNLWIGHNRSDGSWWRLHKHSENIASRSFVFRIFARLQQIEMECRV